MIQTLLWTLRETSTTWSVKSQPWHNLEANESNLQGPSRPWASPRSRAQYSTFVPKAGPQHAWAVLTNLGASNPLPGTSMNDCFFFRSFIILTDYATQSVSSRSLALLLSMAKQMNKTGSFPTKMKHMVFVRPLTLIQQGSWQIVLVLASALQCDTQTTT